MVDLFDIRLSNVHVVVVVANVVRQHFVIVFERERRNARLSVPTDRLELQSEKVESKIVFFSWKNSIQTKIAKLRLATVVKTSKYGFKKL